MINIRFILNFPDARCHELNQAEVQERWEFYKKLRDEYEEGFDNDFEDFDFFNLVIPRPSGRYNRKEWRLNNWGTPSALDGVDLMIEPQLGGSVEIWGQVRNLPIAVINKLAVMGVDISCNYFDEENLKWGFLEPYEDKIEYDLLKISQENLEEYKEEILELKENTHPNYIRRMKLSEKITFFHYEDFSTALDSFTEGEKTFYLSVAEDFLDENLQEIENFINLNGQNDILEKKFQAMELLEEVLEKELINENAYLEMCNILKDGHRLIVDRMTISLTEILNRF
jgi:hypothetical protein